MLAPEKWVDTYGDYLYSVAMLKTNSRETAEDLVQDTFLSAYKAMQSYRGDSSEKTWLLSILKNKIIDHYRKKDVLRNTSEYLADTESDFYDHFFQSDSYSYAHWKPGSTPSAWRSGADEKLESDDFRKVLELCLHKMPPKLVPVFASRFIDDDDPEKICKDFSITPSNYWVIIHRAKLLMRACLEKNWFGTTSHNT